MFKPDAILLGLEAGNREEALSAIAAALASQHEALADKADGIHAALCEREERGSTASHRVAIPHVPFSGLDRIVAVIAVHQNGIPFDALDGEDVHVIVGMLRPEGDIEDHLDTLRQIAQLARHRDFVSFCRQAETESQILDTLQDLSG